MPKLMLLDKESYSTEFERCCRQYSKLIIASAWCGDPSRTLPYSYLDDKNSKLDIVITVGVFFNQTHPDAIKYFMNKGVDIRVFKNEVALFHPKIYLFTKNKKAALFIGSSNFTYSGFFNNVELNMLSEGQIEKAFKKQLKELDKKLIYWHSDKCSFKPSTKWLIKYQDEYKKQRRRETKSNVKSPRDHEESISTASWLRNANWPIYYQKVIDGLDKKKRDDVGYLEVLSAVKEKLPLPWRASYFDDIEKRRIIGGLGKYGWLGHVAASGRFRKFMANGPIREKKYAVTAINHICTLELPINFKVLEKNLNKVVSIGPTMKVWSRILSIIRPDLYCTVASPSVRENLSSTLKVPQNSFETPIGYIRLLNLIHSSPWYNSSKPRNKTELSIWKRRAAFLDAIFY